MPSFEQLSLSDQIQFLKGVGPARAELLNKLGIRNVHDLLFHLPRSYDDLSDVRDLANLTPGTLQTIQGEVVEMQSKTLTDGRRVLSIVIADDKARVVEGIWFNQVYHASQFRYGQRLAFSGKPRWVRDHWSMQHPRVQILLDEGGQPDRRVIPIYALTEGLRADQLHKIIVQALEKYVGLVEEILPPSLRQQRKLPEVSKALATVHDPATIAEALQARRRFIYEEFLALQVALALRRRELRDRRRAPQLPFDQAIDRHIRKLFTFQLTRDQDRAIGAICKDLASDRPMQRLLQADVGAGKTAVAVYALLVAVANKHQAALMAPTEVLARQHWNTVESLLAKSRVRRCLLTGSLSTKERRQRLEEIRSGQIDLVVGTQALLQEDVEFQRLGLVVIDEQHKFGVNQRSRFRKLGVDPHYLVMTATPIPRTLALTMFGDLDTSTIRQLPPGRQPVSTRWVGEPERAGVFKHVEEEARKGRQAYVVCPLVEESETLDVKAAQQTFEVLKKGSFQNLRVGLLHGQMADAEKDRVMGEFRLHNLDVLVTTLVIEVGVDVPNATLMIIEHAERFGLSQLHQLRGRVSRGSVAGECFLFAQTTNPEARDRLKILTRTNDGFALAEADAKLRGLGEVFGTRQHGLADLKFGDLQEDLAVLVEAREDAIAIIADDASLKKPEHAGLRRIVIERYGKTLELAEVG